MVSGGGHGGTIFLINIDRMILIFLITNHFGDDVQDSKVDRSS